ncbi:hypothetical protein NLI96_g7162 [Meripilus lineatus]|uniref:Zn(2)-C6 fungal-type domain-containing protein n=1 Tax=Meripilus lineatus TaxID=2056292 RepID=A0AAD5UZJ2_9APHY|nr:hypothetical protein NLI96_g7162 [Physisporinus lineatus]
MRVLQQREYPSRQPDIMADGVHYPSASHYIPAPAYYTPQPPPSHLHVVAPPQRQEPPQRKRPKYTRSKTGCLTCRGKKIKCDETKPNCMRCTHGQRECTWPEGVPTRKKPAPRKEQSSSQPSTPLESPVIDARPSTAGSSGVSDASTPPTRNHTPPRREPAEIGLPPLVSRRHSEPVIQMAGMPNDADGCRRQQVSNTSHGYPVHSGTNTHMLPAIPEMASAYPHATYQQYPNYAAGQHATSLRPDVPPQWNGPPMMTHVEPLEPYFGQPGDRALVGHSPQQVRYQ